MRTRSRLVAGLGRTVAPEGLIAHGRGEAFDYIAGEATSRSAARAARAAAAALLAASRPVVSVNGNVAALCAREIVALARAARAELEINLFYDSAARRRAIAARLREAGAARVLGGSGAPRGRVAALASPRARVDSRGIAGADVVLVPLEDGDRAEALSRLGKLVIAVDLNPLSRTSLAADITIVDNITRAAPLIAAECRRLRRAGAARLRRVIDAYDNGAVIAAHISEISRYLEARARSCA